MKAKTIAATGLAVTAGALLAYARVARPWTKRWGATDAETAMELPGDVIVSRADYVATRAVTIHATPAEVWPWLVQIGSGRAGWYSYDRLDNGGTPSATTILPEFQNLEVDDLIPMIPDSEIGVWVKEIEPGRRMLWWDRKGEYSWEWLVEPVGADETRLITRLRGTYPPLLSTRTIYIAIATTGDIVMIRRCLLGIRDRAEARARSNAARAAATMEGAA